MSREAVDRAVQETAALVVAVATGLGRDLIGGEQLRMALDELTQTARAQELIDRARAKHRGLTDRSVRA